MALSETLAFKKRVSESAGMHIGRSRRKNSHWNIYFFKFSFKLTALLDFTRRFAEFPDVAVNLWVLTSGQHDAERCPILSFGITKQQRGHLNHAGFVSF